MSSSTSELNAQERLLAELNWEERGRAENLIIRAGAGAGKTTELVGRVLSLMVRFRKKEGRFPRLVVTTFTRKATQELRERLLLKAMELGDPEILRYIQQSRSLQISTIHGSLRRFLSSFGPTLGLAPDFSVMDSLEESRLKKRCLRRLLDQNPERALDFETLLEDWGLSDFWRAFEAWSELRLIHPEATPETPVDLKREMDVFLDHLAEQTQELISRSAGESLTDPWKNLVSQLQEILRQCAALKEDPWGQRKVWTHFRESRVVVRASKSISAEFVDLKKDIFELWDDLGKGAFDPQFARIYERNLKHFLPLVEALGAGIEAEKTRRSQLSLADLELWTLRILRAHPETGEQFAAFWDYWMIDEFQDTSPLQVEILKALTGDRPEFIVGDPQQSIYLFRGARSEVFHEKEDEMQKSGGRRQLLMRNYRSAAKLMGFLNKFLVDLNPTQFQPMEIGSQTQDWEEPQALFWQVPAETREEKIDAVPRALVARVQELLKAGVPAEKICVLGRGNQKLLEFCRLAQDAGLDLHFSGNAGFAERREVRDALAFLRFLVSPHDNLNLLTLLRSPWYQIEDPEIEKIGHSGQESFWQRALRLKGRAELNRQTQAVLDLLLECLKSSLEIGVTQTWLRGLLDRGFIDQSRVFDSSGQRESHFWRLVSDLKFQEREAGFNILKWIEKVEIGQVTDEVSDAEAPAVIEPSRVQVMTIHASKGLQFDHVLLGWAGQSNIRALSDIFVADEESGRFSLGVKGLEDGKLTNSLWAERQTQAFKSREIDEFDRFLYVALTRAKVSVSLIWDTEKANSWMARRPAWAQLPEGHHEIDSFKIESRLRQPEPGRFDRQISTSVPVRTPWTELQPPPRREKSEAFGELEWSRFEKIQKGIDIHRSLELLKHNWDFSDEDELGELKKRLASFREVDLRRVIEDGYVEWAFIVKRQGLGPSGWSSGRIDLWGIVDGEVWIVDYKTGNPRGRDKAVHQLKLYAWTLHQLGLIPPSARVRLLPLFIFEDSSESEDAPPVAELNAWVKTLDLRPASSLE